MEPTSVVSKAWEQSEKIARGRRSNARSLSSPGPGPIGLLAALLGVQRGYEVHVLDRIDCGSEAGDRADLGATFHTGEVVGASGSSPTS